MTKTSVALDGRRLQDQPLGGVGRAIKCMLPHLTAACDVTVLLDETRASVPAPPGVELVALPRIGSGPEATWLHGAARTWCADHRDVVFHGTFNQIPFGCRCPSVVTIWDLTFEVHPEDFRTPRRRLMRQWFRLQARHAARHAGAVVTASEFSAEVISRRYGIPPDRVHLIPIAVDPIFSPRAAISAGEVQQRFGIRSPYIVAVGGAPRRRAERAIGAWQLMRRQGIDVDLAVLGAVDAEPERGLHLLSGVDDVAWSALLAGADLLCYPTSYEGFGLPGLEALASGTPVVAIDGSSVTEVLGSAAAWCEAADIQSIAARMASVLQDGREAQSLREAGLARVASWPSWGEIAERHVRLYDAVG